MRSTILFPHGLSYIPTKNLCDQGTVTFSVLLKSVFLKSKVDLNCTVFGYFIINIKMTWSLSPKINIVQKHIYKAN